MVKKYGFRLLESGWTLKLPMTAAGIILIVFTSACMVRETTSPAKNLQSAELQDSPIRMAEIPFQLSYGKVVLPGELTDSVPLKLLLDTGMQSDGVLIYNPDIRDTIDLKNPISADISGAGRNGPVGAVYSDSMSFRIAGIEFPDQRIIVLQNDSFRGFPSDGVVGFSLLGHYIVEINFDSNEIRLYDPDTKAFDDSWTVVPLFFKENNIPWTTIRIAIENEQPVELSCYIDSASRETIECLTKPDQTFRLPEKLESVYLGRGISGDIHGNRGIIGAVSIGPFELHKLDAVFVPADARSKQPDADGVIGGGFLSYFNVIFDYKHQRLLLKRRNTSP